MDDLIVPDASESKPPVMHEPTGSPVARLANYVVDDLGVFLVYSIGLHVMIAGEMDVYYAAILVVVFAAITWVATVIRVDLMTRSSPCLCDAPSPPARRLVPVLAANALLHLAVIVAYASVVQRGLVVRPQTYAWTLLETTACFVVYETVFYALHRLLHGKLGPYHVLHHETHANLGATNFYMHPVDYALEVIVPLWTAICVVDPSLGATLAVVVIGVANSVVSHSGVKVPGFPDPRDHWLHHHLATCNYGTGPLDLLSGTHRASSSVAFTCRQRV